MKRRPPGLTIKTHGEDAHRANSPTPSGTQKGDSPKVTRIEDDSPTVLREVSAPKVLPEVSALRLGACRPEQEAGHLRDVCGDVTKQKEAGHLRDVCGSVAKSQRELIERIGLQHEGFLEQLGIQLTRSMEIQEQAVQESMQEISGSGTNRTFVRQESGLNISPPGSPMQRRMMSQESWQCGATHSAFSGEPHSPALRQIQSIKSTCTFLNSKGLASMGLKSEGNQMVSYSLGDGSPLDKSRRQIRRAQSLQMEKQLKNRFQRFVSSSSFDYMSALLVLGNAFFIGIQVEYEFDSGSSPSPILDTVDYTFCICFLVEIAARLYAFGCQGYFFLYDREWNIFDFTIVFMSTLDAVLKLMLAGTDSPLGNLSVLRVVRVIRITRAFKVIRVMKFFKDLRVLIAAIAGSFKTATMALFLVIAAMYMFGIAIAQMMADHKTDMADSGTPLSSRSTELKYFGSLAKSMFTLFMTVTGGIDYEVAAEGLYDLPLTFCIYLTFILFSCFCLMNVMTGIFCHAAIETFETDKDKVIESQLADKSRFVDTLATLFVEYEGKCTRKEFEELCNDKQMRSLLNTLDIEIRDAVALFDMMDPESTGLNVEDFIHGCITLRGQAKAVHLERVCLENKAIIGKVDHCNEALEEILTQLNGSSRLHCQRLPDASLDELGASLSNDRIFATRLPETGLGSNLLRPAAPHARGFISSLETIESAANGSTSSGSDLCFHEAPSYSLMFRTDEEEKHALTQIRKARSSESYTEQVVKQKVPFAATDDKKEMCPKDREQQAQQQMARKRVKQQMAEQQMAEQQMTNEEPTNGEKEKDPLDRVQDNMWEQDEPLW